MKMRIISALLGIGISLMMLLSDASAATTAVQQQAAAKKAQQQQAAQMRKIQQQAQAQQRAYMAQQQKLYQAQQKAYQAQQKAYQAQQKKALEAQQKEAAKKPADAVTPDKTAKGTDSANGIAKGLGGAAGMAKATQTKRIEQDVNKGYLVSDEVAKLDKEQAAIVKLQKQFAANGTVGKDDAAQLRGMVKDTSLAIWVQKHDVESGQKPAFRLGENLRLNPEVAAKLGDENLSTADARKILTGFHALCQDKKQLNGDLADAERAKLQKQYDDLLNQYFALK